MAKLADYVPDVETAISLTPEDLGIILLKLVQKERGRNFTLSDLQVQGKNLAHTASHSRHDKALSMERVLAEAWQWLLNEGLVMGAPDQPSGYYCLTRKGAALKTQGDVDTYRQGNLLPVGLLHPRIAEKVRPMFLRGDYDVAVFHAFKEVEVAVRAGGKFDDDLVGTKLMRRAFAETGPLASMGLVLPEREAIAHLYAGAIGHCKNPQSHREVRLHQVAAAQLIVLASYLLADVEETVLDKLTNN